MRRLLAAAGLMLASTAATCAPYYTTEEFKRGHPDSLVGEWREVDTAKSMKLWANGHYGRCGDQAGWELAPAGRSHSTLVSAAAKSPIT